MTNENPQGNARSDAQRPSLTDELGKPLAEVTDVERLRADVEFLWSIIDDIDTASDMAKGNEGFYRARVKQLQSKRHQRVTSDGYGLFVVPLCRNDGRCQYAIDHGAEGLGHCPPGKCCMPNVEVQPTPKAVGCNAVLGADSEGEQ